MATREGPEPRKVPAERPGPSGGKRDENRRRRTQALGEAGLVLFLERGIESVTIDEIVAAAGVSKGTFYRYFEDKRDLVAGIFTALRAAADRAFARATEAIDAARDQAELTRAYESFGEDVTVAVLADPRVVLLYLQEARGPAVGAREPVRTLADRISVGAIELTDAAHAHGLLRPVNPRVSATAVVGAVEKLLFETLSGNPPADPLELPQAVISIVLDGLRPE